MDLQKGPESALDEIGKNISIKWYRYILIYLAIYVRIPSVRKLT